MSEQHITIRVPIQLGNELGAALDLLDERLIGHIPACLVELDRLILENTLRPRVMVMVGWNGEPGPWEKPRDLTPDEEAELDRITDEMNIPSPEQLAEEARAERFRAFCTSKQEETNRWLEEWFQDYANKFQRDLAHHQRTQGRGLQMAFRRHEAGA
ncbi:MULTISPECIES: hypothetical protein [unclassified Pseudoclavibacter]|uniref:hypothetical protein n=1 Tax=unclassified Pseudoclavibacter TaxID=2615177 RepID=UPI001BADFC80|nr:hypothetical protein [Pseudoclavibacter sp. Marseille-Q4354]MBS3177209.1 hypothetical protein [Pseudoclavibacter sp. Marseille-Q4354]